MVDLHLMYNKDQHIDLILYGFTVSLTDNSGKTKRVDPQNVYAINAAHYGTCTAKHINDLIQYLPGN
jgi:hypothetical protein